MRYSLLSSSITNLSPQNSQLKYTSLSGQSPFIFLPHCGHFIMIPPTQRSLLLFDTLLLLYIHLPVSAHIIQAPDIYLEMGAVPEEAF